MGALGKLVNSIVGSLLCLFFVLLTIGLLAYSKNEDILPLRDNNINSEQEAPPAPAPPSQSSEILIPPDAAISGVPMDMVKLVERSPIFQFTQCGLIEGTSLPRSCEAEYFPTPFTAFGNFTRTFFSVEDYYGFISQEYENSNDGWGSEESNFEYWYNDYFELDYSLTVSVATWSTLRIVLPSPRDIPLNSAFLEDLQKLQLLLKGVYDYDTIYNYFIMKYGTHFPYAENRGGSIRYYSLFMNCVARDYSTLWVEQNTEGLLDILVDGTSYYQESSYFGNRNYQFGVVEVIGGSILQSSSVNPEAVDEWIPTIFDNPKYLGYGGTWYSITDIFPSSFAPLASMVNQAINEYFTLSVKASKQMVKYQFPYYPTLSSSGSCLSVCPSYCVGQLACPYAGTCSYYYGLTVSKISNAPCGEDDDDSSHQDNCIRSLQAGGLCGVASTDSHEVCYAYPAVASVSLVPCSSYDSC